MMYANLSHRVDHVPLSNQVNLHMLYVHMYILYRTGFTGTPDSTLKRSLGLLGRSDLIAL